MRACLILAVALVWAVILQVTIRADTAGVPFQLRDASDIVVSVNVDGRGPFRFLLDTGSARSGVRASLAESLHLSAAGETVVLTPGGRSVRRLVQAVFEFADARSAVTAMVLAPRDLGARIDGVLGSDFLAAGQFTIDYSRRRLFLDGRHRERGMSVALTHGPGGFLATLPGSEAGQPLRLVPDTGTPAFVLFDRSSRKLPRMTPLIPVPLRGVGTIRVGRAVLLEHLQIGCIQLRELHAVLMPDSGSNERFEDGLLPLHVFAQVTFDRPRGTLTLVARPGPGSYAAGPCAAPRPGAGASLESANGATGSPRDASGPPQRATPLDRLPRR